jgi:hypothetical protein
MDRIHMSLGHPGGEIESEPLEEILTHCDSPAAILLLLWSNLSWAAA